MRSLDLEPKQSWLVWALRGILLLGVVILIGRLAELQIIKGSYFRALAEDNRTRKIPIVAPRGAILARGGEILIGSSQTDQIPRENVLQDWKRSYPLGHAFAHVGGYLGSVSAEELGKVNPKCPEKGPYAPTAQIGRSGLEEAYSCLLRGIDGEQLIEVDTFGKKVRILGSKKPIVGSDLRTTIDYGLQQKVAEIFDNAADLPADKKGAVIVSDGEGQVLALYSSPSFEPEGDMQKYLTDSTLPLFDRVISGAYHPGSVFKIVTATGALEEGKISRDYLFNDPGVIRVKEFSYSNWLFTQYGRTEGEINVIKALARSTDTFFYKVGELLGVDSLASWARKFGYGKAAGIDISGEVDGLIPDPQWKKEAKGENWFLGNTYHMAIGQGDVVATPLEVNMMTAVIANNGYLCKPYLVNSGKLKSGNCTKLPISDATLDTIKSGMKGACSPGGTAVPFFSFTPQIACKTGTAETEEKDKTHAWFTSFGPVNPSDSTMPSIVVSVLVEKGGEGSAVAAPIAEKIFHYWLYDRNP